MELGKLKQVQEEKKIKQSLNEDKETNNQIQEQLKKLKEIIQTKNNEITNKTIKIENLQKETKIKQQTKKKRRINLV